MKLENWNVICDIRVPVSLFFQSFHFLSIWSKKKKKKVSAQILGLKKKRVFSAFHGNGKSFSHRPRRHSGDQKTE